MLTGPFPLPPRESQGPSLSTLCPGHLCHIPLLPSLHLGLGLPMSEERECGWAGGWAGGQGGSLPCGHLNPGLCFLACQAACCLCIVTDPAMLTSSGSPPPRPLPPLWSGLGAPAFTLGIPGPSQNAPLPGGPPAPAQLLQSSKAICWYSVRPTHRPTVSFPRVTACCGLPALGSSAAQQDKPLLAVRHRWALVTARHQSWVRGDIG